MRFAKAVDQYLTRHAAPEASWGRRLQQTVHDAVVVPACDETPDFVDRLLASEQRPLLLVVVVNGGNHHPPRVHQCNADTYASLVGRIAVRERDPAGMMGSLGPHQLILIDRWSPARRMPPKSGVGLARKIGCDVALAAWHAGKVRSRFIHWSDADIRLPPNCFDVDVPADAVALTYPYNHVPCGEAQLDDAHRQYECYLRYHVLGLRHAASPYAYHAIGSIMAVAADAYAAVRGVPPKRTAGEDFYMLNKLAKLGPVFRPRQTPIEIASRHSARVPFGTGPAVAQILEATDGYHVYDPRCYVLLRRWQHHLLHTTTAELPPAAEPMASVWQQALDKVDALAQMRKALANPTAQPGRRLQQHFDAFRTLKLIHAFRDSGLPDIPLLEAITKAPFLPPIVNGDIASVLEQLRNHDRSTRDQSSAAKRAGA